MLSSSALSLGAPSVTFASISSALPRQTRCTTAAEVNDAVLLQRLSPTRADSVSSNGRAARMPLMLALASPVVLGRRVCRRRGQRNGGFSAPAGAGSVVARAASVVSPAAGVGSFSFTSVPMKGTPAGISVHDITPQVRACVAAHFANRRSTQRDGVVTVISRHTTTAVTINEDETRLREDIVQFLQKLAPADAVYKHNDLHLRPASEKDRAAIDRNWMSKGKGTLEEFMAQEPINAHSHLLAIMVGQSESIPIVGGELVLGQWQSVLFLDLDGPQDRTVGVQVMG